jgi:hypothetical protein
VMRTVHRTIDMSAVIYCIQSINTDIVFVLGPREWILVRFNNTISNSAIVKSRITMVKQEGYEAGGCVCLPSILQYLCLPDRVKPRITLSLDNW